MLLWTLMSKALFFDSFLSVLLGIHLRVELLGHMVILYFTFLGNCQTFFHSCYTILYAHQQDTRVAPSHFHEHLLFCTSLTIVEVPCPVIFNFDLMGVSWFQVPCYMPPVWIWISHLTFLGLFSHCEKNP